MYTQLKANEIFANVYDNQQRITMPEIDITGFANTSHPAIPSINPNYIFRKDLLRDVLAFLRKPHGDALYLSGPTGSGKTSVVTEIAARLHWPVQQITMNGRFEFSQLKGQIMVRAKEGSQPETVFMHGPLATAMKEGHILLLNEIDLADPAELSGLNDVLEGRPLVIAENDSEIIKPHPMFRVVATANSFGSGDDTGMYQGVLQQNLAALDRYRFLEVDYMEEFAEREVLDRVATSIPDEIKNSMIQLANEIRKLFKGNDDGNIGNQLALTMSTRTLVRWALLAQDFRSAPNQLHYALDQALLLRASSEDKAVITNLAKGIFGAVWEKSQAKKVSKKKKD